MNTPVYAPVVDVEYIAEELSELTSQKVTITTARYIASTNKYHAVAHIGKCIISGEGKSINQLINNINEYYGLNS